MALDKSSIRRPVLRKEAVPAPSLGDDDVIVRQLTLTEMLDLGRGAQLDEVAQVLAWCCIDPDGKPLLSIDEWQAWGAAYPHEAVALYQTAIRLTGHAEKKTPA